MCQWIFEMWAYLKKKKKKEELKMVGRSTFSLKILFIFPGNSLFLWTGHVRVLKVLFVNAKVTKHSCYCLLVSSAWGPKKKTKNGVIPVSLFDSVWHNFFPSKFITHLFFRQSVLDLCNKKEAMKWRQYRKQQKCRIYFCLEDIITHNVALNVEHIIILSSLTWQSFSKSIKAAKRN